MLCRWPRNTRKPEKNLCLNFFKKNSVFMGWGHCSCIWFFCVVTELFCRTWFLWLNTATVYSVQTSCRKYEPADLRLLASYQTSPDLGLGLCVVARGALNGRCCNGKQEWIFISSYERGFRYFHQVFCFNFTVIIFFFILSEYLEEENNQNKTFFQEKKKQTKTKPLSA